MNHYSDFLEKEIAETLSASDIRFIHESKGKNQRLDFFLPDHNVYIEIKQYHTDRINEQLKLKENIILLQGKKSVRLFKELLTKS